MSSREEAASRDAIERPATPSLRRATRRGRLAGGPAIQSERLVQVLLHLAEVEDESAISMRRIAAELGVSARLLYQYVSGRAELLSLLTDAISAHFSVPAPGTPWRERLVSIAWSTWNVIRRYPGLSPRTFLDSTRYLSSRHARRMTSEVKKALCDSGLPPLAASQAHLFLAAHLLGHLMLLEKQRQTSAERKLTYDGIFDWSPLESSFEISLNSLIAGIEEMVEREKLNAVDIE
jgi:AcrR family transcriptional regulator